MNSYTRYSYPLFNELPISLKLLYTMVLLILGLGYLFALIQVYEVHSGRDGKPGISIQDIQIAYRGSNDGTRLESAIKGPMASMLPQEESAAIISWLHGDKSEASFRTQVAPILEARCSACHDGANPHLPKLIEYEDVMKVAVSDTGVSIGTLVRVSHIHLFGLTFIFAFMGLIFSHAYTRRPWLKNLVIILPFVAIFLDVASWWLTKVADPFGYIVFASGALMGLSFAYQWSVSLYQLWFFKCPDDVCEVP